MQTFTDTEGREWPPTIEVNGRTMRLHLLDPQTGDSSPVEKAVTEYHPNSLRWLDIIYKED